MGDNTARAYIMGVNSPKDCNPTFTGENQNLNPEPVTYIVEHMIPPTFVCQRNFTALTTT